MICLYISDLEYLRDPSRNIHPAFRNWITNTDPDHFPSIICSSGEKLVLDGANTRTGTEAPDGAVLPVGAQRIKSVNLKTSEIYSVRSYVYKILYYG